MLEQCGRDVTDRKLLESQISPVKDLAMRWSGPRVLEEQERLKDDAALQASRIAYQCRKPSQELDILSFEGKLSMSAAFGLKVEAAREDVSITMALDPKFTTIGQTLASPRERSRRCRWA